MTGPRITFVTPEEADRTWCPASRPLPSGATLRCRLAPEHDGPHDDGDGDPWADPPTGQQVTDALRAAGFQHVGGRDGVYMRLGWPEHVTASPLMVPLEPGNGDYEPLLSAVMRELQYAAEQGRVAQAALDALTRTEFDR